MPRLQIRAFWLAILLFACGLSAQSNKKPLTNADVVEMVHAGLGESTIILSIKSSQTNFDLSPQSLITLKKNGVSQTIMDAMLNAANSANTQAAASLNKDDGRALMKKVVAAMGGEKAIQAVKSIRVTSTKEVKTPSLNTTLELVQTSVLPDKIELDVKSPQYNSRTVYHPNGSFLVLNGKPQPLSEAAQQEVLNVNRMSMINIAQHVDDPAYSFVVTGEEKIGEVKTAILEISINGSQTRWNIDPASGKLVRVTRNVMGPTGSATLMRFEYADWRNVNGVSVPFTVFQNGAPSQVKAYEINPELPAGFFEKSNAPTSNSSASLQNASTTGCPVEILQVDPHSFVGASDDPWGYALKVKYKNTTSKEIVAEKFAANFYNALHEKKESAWNYTGDQKIKPGETKTASWSDGVYVNEIGMRIGAEVWVVKVMFADESFWEDDGSSQCKSGIWATPVK